MLIFTTLALATAAAIGKASFDEKHIQREIDKAWAAYMQNNQFRMNFRTSLKQIIRKSNPSISTSRLASIENVLMDEMMESGMAPPGFQWWRDEDGKMRLLFPGWGIVPMTVFDNESREYIRVWLRNRYLDPSIRHIDEGNIHRFTTGDMRPLSLYTRKRRNRYEENYDAKPYREGMLKVVESKNPEPARIPSVEAGPFPNVDANFLEINGEQVIPRTVILPIEGPRSENARQLMRALERMGIHFAKDKEGRHFSAQDNWYDLPQLWERDYRSPALDGVNMGLRLMYLTSEPGTALGGEWYVLHPIPEDVPEWVIDLDSVADLTEQNSLARKAESVMQYISERRLKELGL